MIFPMQDSGKDYEYASFIPGSPAGRFRRAGMGESDMITKNRQSDETITAMAKKAFPDKTVLKIKELTEGMCNVTYHVVFEDGSESILKIAAENTAGNTSNEINLMRAEVEAMAEAQP